MGKHTKESILNVLRNLAAELGKETLTKREVQPHIPHSSLNYHFGSLGNALEEAGLKRGDSTTHLRNRQPLISDDDLFHSLLDVEQQIGHEPGAGEYNVSGSYSNKPYSKRFGDWKTVIQHYRKWRAENGISVDTKEDISTAGCDNSSGVIEVDKTIAEFEPTKRRQLTPAQLYGEPIDFRGLRHAPINEQGVVYLFGMVSRELGFSVESVQQGFPDCEAKYLYDRNQNLWAKARIEFEFKSSNFTQHGHDSAQCDFIVCWVNDWTDCPIEVIELKSELRKLPNR